MKYKIDQIVGKEVISVQELKEYLHITHNHEDKILANMISAARNIAEEYLRQCLIDKVIILYIHGYHNIKQKITLPFEPILSIKKIIYNYSNILDPKLYHLVENNLYIKNNNISYIQDLQIIYQTKIDYIHDAVKQGILVHAALIYEGKYLNNTIPMHCIALYNPLRNISL